MPRSSSVTRTVTVARTPTPEAESATVACSLSASSSACAVTVTVCAVFQFSVVNVSDAGSAVAAPASELATDTVVLAAGALCSTAVKVPTLALPVALSFSARLGGDTVASSDVATGTVAETSVPASACADAATVTPRVRAVSKSWPLWASVSVAVVSPAATVASEPMESPGTLVFSVKFDDVTPDSNVVSASVTVTSAPSIVASVSGDGLVAIVAVGSTTVIVNVSSARSLSARLVSPSWAWIVTVWAPAVFVVGVPHTVRAGQFGAAKLRPAGRPLAE